MTYELTRRSLLLAGAVAGGVALLGGCGSGATPRATPAGPPRRGGTLRAAFVGGGAAESLDVFSSGTSMDFVRARAMHASLGDLDPAAPGGFRSHVLAGVEPAPDLSAYTLRVRKGVRFSDGSPLTARDVAYSLNLAATAAPIGSLAVFAADFDVARLRVLDDATLTLPTRRPIADGATILCLGTSFVFKDGTKEFTARMPTSGPFRLTQFDPGRGAALARNEHFSGTGGGPYLDGLELLSIPDGDARLNALRGKQVDYAHDLSPVQARTAQADPDVRVVEAALPSVTSLYFQLNMARPPFDDPRVRMAFRLAVNRPAILDTVLFGRGKLGNDLLSLGYPDYAELPQRAHDPGKAKDLLRAANASDLSVTLTTGPESPGMVESATLYAEHLKEIGVRVNLREMPAGQLYADFAAYSALPFAGGYASATPPMVIYQIIYQGGNPFGFGWNRPDVDAMVLDARAARAPDAARAKATTVQRMLADEGNTVVPVFKPSLSARAPNLIGVEKGLFEQHPSFVEASLQ